MSVETVKTHIDPETLFKGITCIVQISSPVLPVVPVQGFFGTAEGIKNGLAKLTANGIKQLAIMSKEEKPNDDKEQG